MFFLCSYLLKAQDYYPMSVGNTWVYNRLNENGVFYCTDSVVIKDNYSVDGKSIFLFVEHIVRSNSTDIMNMEMYNDISNNNDIYNIYEGIGYKVFQHQYTNNDSWISGGYNYTVSYLGTVSVPAGTFNSCYCLKMGSLDGWVVAPNVGLIKTFVENRDENVLRRYSLNSGTNLIGEEYIGKATIYPNPVIDCFTIPNISDLSRVQIYDLTGRAVLNLSYRNYTNDKIDVSDLTSGLYFGKIILKNSKYYSFRFIKQ